MVIVGRHHGCSSNCPGCLQALRQMFASVPQQPLHPPCPVSAVIAADIPGVDTGGTETIPQRFSRGSEPRSCLVCDI